MWGDGVTAASCAFNPVLVALEVGAARLIAVHEQQRPRLGDVAGLDETAAPVVGGEGQAGWM